MKQFDDILYKAAEWRKENQEHKTNPPDELRLAAVERNRILSEKLRTVFHYLNN